MCGQVKRTQAEFYSAFLWMAICELSFINKCSRKGWAQ